MNEVVLSIAVCSLILYQIVSCDDVVNGMVLIIPQHKLVLGRTKENFDSKKDWKKLDVKPFLISETPITNTQFSEFVSKQKFKTEAEVFKWSFVFEKFVSDDIKEEISNSVKGAEWWLPVEGAYWKHPSGPGSSAGRKPDHPAVHISYNDAVEYCQAQGARLPSEPEWEFAARGGMRDQQYPWGNGYEKNRMNIWQGKFPKENKGKDGYIGVAPAKAFKPQNPFGLYDMIGNTWEWTSTVFGVDSQTRMPQYTLRGGSYVDSVDGKFNHRADVTTRMGNTADAGSDNIGFRCARDATRKDMDNRKTGKQEL